MAATVLLGQDSRWPRLYPLLSTLFLCSYDVKIHSLTDTKITQRTKFLRGCWMVLKLEGGD